jgi:hypothetical protein
MRIAKKFYLKNEMGEKCRQFLKGEKRGPGILEQKKRYFLSSRLILTEIQIPPINAILCQGCLKKSFLLLFQGLTFPLLKMDSSAAFAWLLAPIQENF